MSVSRRKKKRGGKRSLTLENDGVFGFGFGFVGVVVNDDAVVNDDVVVNDEELFFFSTSLNTPPKFNFTPKQHADENFLIPSQRFPPRAGVLAEVGFGVG